jgi:hypothetical protein
MPPWIGPAEAEEEARKRCQNRLRRCLFPMFVKRRPWQRDANDQSERPGPNGDELPWAIRMPTKAKAVSRAHLGSVDSWSLVLFSAAKNSAHLPAHRPQSRQLLPLLPPPPQFPALTQSLLSRVPCSSLLVPRPTRCLRPLTYHLVHFPSIPTNFLHLHSTRPSCSPL